MKISILLPTRNRLDYLKLAVESVLRQDVESWQLVISDNCSEENIADFVSSLDDPRIVYTRSDRFIPVTANWSRALAHSDGDYIIMLGDDDALAPGYLRRMNELIERFHSPDVIYTKTLLFTYPGVDPAYPAGFLMDNGCADFFAGASAPFLLEHARARELVDAAMAFRLRYDFNAQFALIGRRLIESLRAYGDFYQSDFPDYYSMNAVFLTARSIVIEPEPMTVVGVTPKSYGYFHVNDLESEGRAFLEGASAPPTTGTNINIGWLSAVTALEKGVGGEQGLRVSHRRFRLVQAAHVYKRYRAGAGTRAEVRAFERELPWLERWLYRVADQALALIHRVLPQRLKAMLASRAAQGVGQLPAIDPEFTVGRFGNIIDVYDELAAAQTGKQMSLRGNR